MVLVVKNPLANAGGIKDTGSISGSGRSLGEGHGNLLQYSCLGNPMDSGTWWATVMGLQRVGHNWSNLACTSFPWGKKEQSALMYLKMVVYPRLASHKGIFLWYLLWTSGCIPGDNGEGPCDCMPLEFLTLKVVHTEPPAIHQLWFKFSYPGTDFCSSFCLSVLQ